MNGWMHKSVALALAAFYGALGVASHGLHDLGCCSDDHAASTCCHDHCHEHHHPVADDATELGFRTFARGHDAAKCAACALVAKLKSSVVQAPAVIVQAVPVVASVAPATVVLHAVSTASFPARGPPADQA